MRNRFYTPVFAAIAAICVGYYTFSYNGQNRSPTKVNLVNESGDAELAPAAAPTTSEDDTPTYVFENGDPNDPFQGDQFFGSMDKVGIALSVKNAIEPHTASTLARMAQENQARHAFLQTEGHQFRSPPGTWDVEIVEVGSVASQPRLAVVACLGKDGEHNGGVFYDGEAMVHEVWSLDSNGQLTLLDRSMDPHISVQTQAEAPNPTVELPSMEGLSGGSGDPFDPTLMGLDPPPGSGGPGN